MLGDGVVGVPARRARRLAALAASAPATPPAPPAGLRRPSRRARPRRGSRRRPRPLRPRRRRPLRRRPPRSISSSGSRRRRARMLAGCCGDRAGLLDRVHLLALLDQERLLAAHRGVGIDRDGDAEALLEVAQMRALVVEHVEGDLGARAHDEIVGGALQQRFLEHAQELQRDRRRPSARGRCRRNAGTCRSSFPARWCGCAGATSPSGRNARCGRPGCGRGRSSGTP